ncbi:MAG: hypothetical protein K2Q14_06445 [Gammaproteobacteria bacterium]|nr:hypothetical protein [Gammaproteobacteria bacterium]
MKHKKSLNDLKNLEKQVNLARTSDLNKKSVSQEPPAHEEFARAGHKHNNNRVFTLGEYFALGNDSLEFKDTNALFDAMRDLANFDEFVFEGFSKNLAPQALYADVFKRACKLLTGDPSLQTEVEKYINFVYYCIHNDDIEALNQINHVLGEIEAALRLLAEQSTQRMRQYNLLSKEEKTDAAWDAKEADIQKIKADKIASLKTHFATCYDENTEVNFAEFSSFVNVLGRWTQGYIMPHNPPPCVVAHNPKELKFRDESPLTQQRIEVLQGGVLREEKNSVDDQPPIQTKLSIDTEKSHKKMWIQKSKHPLAPPLIRAEATFGFRLDNPLLGQDPNISLETLSITSKINLNGEPQTRAQSLVGPAAECLKEFVPGKSDTQDMLNNLASILIDGRMSKVPVSAVNDLSRRTYLILFPNLNAKENEQANVFFCAALKQMDQKEIPSNNVYINTIYYFSITKQHSQLKKFMRQLSGLPQAKNKREIKHILAKIWKNEPHFDMKYDIASSLVRWEQEFATPSTHGSTGVNTIEAENSQSQLLLSLLGNEKNPILLSRLLTTDPKTIAATLKIKQGNAAARPELCISSSINLYLTGEHGGGGDNTPIRVSKNILTIHNDIILSNKQEKNIKTVHFTGSAAPLFEPEDSMEEKEEEEISDVFSVLKDDNLEKSEESVEEEIKIEKDEDKKNEPIDPDYEELEIEGHEKERIEKRENTLSQDSVDHLATVFLHAPEIDIAVKLCELQLKAQLNYGMGEISKYERKFEGSDENTIEGQKSLKYTQLYLEYKQILLDTKQEAYARIQAATLEIYQDAPANMDKQQKNDRETQMFEASAQISNMLCEEARIRMSNASLDAAKSNVMILHRSTPLLLAPQASMIVFVTAAKAIWKWLRSAEKINFTTICATELEKSLKAMQDKIQEKKGDTKSVTILKKSAVKLTTSYTLRQQEHSATFFANTGRLLSNKSQSLSKKEENKLLEDLVKVNQPSGRMHGG